MNGLSHSILKQVTKNSDPFSIHSIESLFWIENRFESNRENPKESQLYKTYWLILSFTGRNMDTIILTP